MALFRRGDRDPGGTGSAEVERQARAIEAFWRWWTQAGAAEAAAAIADLLLVGQAFLSTLGGSHLHPVLAAPVELNAFILKISYLLVIACLLGYLSQKEKELRAQTVVTARVIEQARVRSGVRGAISAIVGELLRLFEARWGQKKWKSRNAEKRALRYKVSFCARGELHHVT